MSEHLSPCPCVFCCLPCTQLSTGHGVGMALESGPGQLALVWGKGQTELGLGLREGSCMPAASSTRRVGKHWRPPRWPLSSGVCFLLCARPKSSTSPWTAWASPLQRAFSSGRGLATATLILLKKSSLWTTYKLDSCPSRPRGEGVAPCTSLPVRGVGPVPGLKCPPKAFSDGVIKGIAFQLGCF